jgi:excisionase family DNA binding protein
MAVQNDPEYYTTAEAARLLRITPSGVVKRIERGQLPATHMGGKGWKIPRQAVDALLQPPPVPQQR